MTSRRYAYAKALAGRRLRLGLPQPVLLLVSRSSRASKRLLLPGNGTWRTTFDFGPFRPTKDVRVENSYSVRSVSTPYYILHFSIFPLPHAPFKDAFPSPSSLSLSLLLSIERDSLQRERERESLSLERESYPA